MPKLTDFVGTVTSLTAGAACNQGDLLEIYADSYVYSSQITDLMATTSVAAIAAMTNINGAVAAGQTQTLVSGNNPGILVDPNGLYTYSIYHNSSGGIGISKNSTITGQQIATLAPFFGFSSGYNTYTKMVFLSNGNIVLFGVGSTAPYYQYAIFNPVTMAQVLAPTAPTNAYSGGYGIDVFALSGGGFGLVYVSATTNSNQVTLYNNAGTQQSTGTIGYVQWTADLFSAAQLSNGNIAIMVCSNTGPAKLTVLNSSLGTVSALAAITGFPSSPQNPSWNTAISVLPSGFAVVQTGNVSFCFSCYAVFNNSGVQQGSTYQAPTNSYSYTSRAPLFNDGTNFWGVTFDANSLLAYVQLTTAGVATLFAPAVSSSGGSNILGACITPGNIIIVALTSGYIFAFSTALQAPIGTANASTYGFSGATPQVCLGMVYAADGVVVVGSMTGTTTNPMQLGVFKAIATAIVGVAQGATAAGAKVTIDTSSGWKTINTLKGTSVKNIPASNSPVGQACNIVANTAYMRGFNVAPRNIN